MIALIREQDGPWHLTHQGLTAKHRPSESPFLSLCDQQVYLFQTSTAQGIVDRGRTELPLCPACLAVLLRGG